MTDPIDQIAERWAACEGFLSPRVSTTEEDTDLEYRGRAGKWTLATVFDTDESTGQAWLQAFLNAREDVEVLLTEVRRLRAGARDRAVLFAQKAHGDQKRKYTGEPYLQHCVNVAGLTLDAKNFSPEMYIAAVLHDTIEDTPATAEDIALAFGPYVAGLVVELTDVSKPSDGNRAARKALDRAHLAQASAAAQTIKVCDLIDNTASIVAHDPKFARVYLAEKRALLEVLTRADAGLLARAWEQLNGANA